MSVPDFTVAILKDTFKKLVAIERRTSPLDIPIKKTPDMFWVEPNLVCSITYSEITDDGNVRHPVFQGMRLDKDPLEVEFD